MPITDYAVCHQLFSFISYNVLSNGEKWSQC